jgi:eukaryotic-like serine/threonine-protein kinase
MQIKKAEKITFLRLFLNASLKGDYFMEGQILGNRYEVIEKIGGGGMSIVYKAKCKLLNRFVAVKILRPEFTQDEEFVKRFRIEAQSAASLSHPNIVSIYDVGNDNGTYYIIMEYIDGITLKEYVDSKEELAWREAVNISIQIGSAIDHAHKNHIVHRDIKPHNIMLTKDGIAKVTDFGIARAVSSSTITMVGSTIGSVHYFSPEQARGGFVDEKSDLYSLGITLYEMVTGRLPFDGETPIAVALKHIQLDAKPPIELNSNIPKALNDIIMKAIKKEQNKRYQSANEILSDLNLVLKDPSSDFVIQSELEESPTRRIKTIGDEKNDKRDEYLIKDNDRDKDKKAKKVDKLTIILAIITGAVLIVFLSFLIGKWALTPFVPAENKSFVVDNYVGMNFDEVKKTMDDNAIQVVRNDEFNKDVQPGIIISQSVDKGKTLKRDGYNNIEFGVSKGVEKVKIPDLKNQDHRQAEDTITAAGLTPNTIQENNDTIPQNRVIRTDPAVDEEVVKDKNTVVNIYVSIGPLIVTTKVPNLVGKTQQEALQLLSDAKLVIGKQTPEIGSDYTTKVTAQNPLPNTDAKEGDAVDLFYDKSVTTVSNQEYTLSLRDDTVYGDTIQVKIMVTQPNSESITFMDEQKNKTDFPFIIVLPYPEKTKVDIYLDGQPYDEKVIPFK